MNKKPKTYTLLYAAKKARVAASLNNDVINQTNHKVRIVINREIANKINSELIKQTK